MRLLHFDEYRRLKWTEFSSNIPPYAVLSHTWNSDEFLFEDLVNGTGTSKTGYGKVEFCAKQAARDQIQYFWIDTCCIDKWNLLELSNAINSMFSWYRNAAKCYVFLSDVSVPVAIDAQLHQNIWEVPFRKSRWFTRGWTLQELIAPVSIEFFSSEHQWLGDKKTLEQQVQQITGIPVEALQGDPLDDFSVAERMAWVAGRQTTLEEDIAYCLIGIFGVSMESRYGEGKEKALTRLREEVEKASVTPFIIPFDRNARFVGRESQLAVLEGKLFVGTSTTKVAIIGPGGIGKTQLALELAYRTRQKYKSCSIFWIPASDVESIHQAYMHIAQRLNIPGWDDEKADVKKLVQLHLSQASAGQWLIVFDNADEAGPGTTGPSQTGSLTEYLPSSKQGSILFITTDSKMAVSLASQNIVKLPEIERDMAHRILKTYLTNPTNEQDADLLLKELAYLPLAIVQAAAYINVNKTTLKDYLSLLGAQEKEVVERISKQFDEWQPHRTGNPIATTLLISFEQIRNCDILATDFLYFMACIDRKDIPLALLPTTSPPRGGMDAVETLNAYSFITKRQAESALDLHRLVHLAIRNWLHTQGLLSKRTQLAITRLLEVFPDSKHENRSKWRRLLPHAKYALSYDLMKQEDEAGIELTWKCAMSLHSDGRYNEAEELFAQVMETRKRVLGAEHPDTLTSMANLASTYRNQGRWKAAEELEVQVMETCKKKLGTDHPDTLNSMSNLASTYRNQGQWDAAEELEVQVIETSTTKLGADHPSTLTYIANLASTYRNQGRWKEAEELEMQVMETCKKKLGADHPDTLTSMANLASTWKAQGRDTEAIGLMTECVRLQERILGASHPYFISSSNTLADWEAKQ
ncbi:HET-domain-containing protein [Zopfia rhizophila CBS 207.26]|uniref:HET-domain-containing protein n=1 Tax=Zopfia rhizophila CBS 207.26 TaxID=1314779 RepID=A0A6A6EA54_9PEZI|nr:HET-domain-containing protein [Zopfia rhizophila CBS 207.26]